MSVTLEARVNNHTLKSFDTVLDEWAKASQERQDISICITPYDEPVRYYVFGAGSIRGVVLAPVAAPLGNGTITATVRTMASRVDWKLCYALMLELLRNHDAIVSIEDHRLTPDELGESSSQERAVQALRTDVVALKAILDRDGGPLTLPNLDFDVTVSREQLDGVMTKGGSITELENELAEAAKPLGLSYHADLIVLKSGETFNVFHSEGALLNESNYVVLPILDPSTNSLNESDFRFVTFQEFVMALDPWIRIVQKNPHVYHMARVSMDDARMRQAYEQLLAVARTELP